MDQLHIDITDPLGLNSIQQNFELPYLSDSKIPKETMDFLLGEEEEGEILSQSPLQMAPQNTQTNELSESVLKPMLQSPSPVAPAYTLIENFYEPAPKTAQKSSFTQYLNKNSNDGLNKFHLPSLEERLKLQASREFDFSKLSDEAQKTVFPKFVNYLKYSLKEEDNGNWKIKSFRNGLYTLTNPTFNGVSLTAKPQQITALKKRRFATIDKDTQTNALKDPYPQLTESNKVLRTEMNYLRTRLEHEKRQNTVLNNHYQQQKREIEKLTEKLSKSQKTLKAVRVLLSDVDA